MEGLEPLVMEVYDKDFAYQGTISRPQDVTMTPRHNAAGTGAFTLDSDADAVEALAADGANMVCRYRHDEADPYSPMYLLGGPVKQVDLGGALGAPTRTFAVTDWWDILTKYHCRSVPGSGWGGQGGEGTFYSTSGPMETVVKTLVSQNLGINPWDLTVAATHGWGETVTIQVHQNILTDRIFPALDFAGVGISVRNSGSGLVLDGYLPTIHSEPLTAESGIVTKGAGSIMRPEVSRVLVRGGSEPSQVYREVVNTAVEAAHGFIGWAPVLDVSESTTTSYLDAKGWEVLNAGARRSSVAIELAETDDWRFGTVFNLGDQVSITLSGAPVITETIREVELTWSTTSGLVVTPRLGDQPATPFEAQSKALQKLATRQRVTQARG